MHGKHWLLAGLLAAATLLPSCALLPEEEAIQTAPVIRRFEHEGYDMAQVFRGDMVLTEKVNCRYVPVQTKDLSFGIPGEYVDEIFAQVGDAVVQGQLLGQLQLGDLPERIEQTQREAEELKLQLKHMDASHEIGLRRFEIEHAQTEASEKQELLDALEEAYTLRRIDAEDELYLREITLAQMRDDLDQRQIRAPFAGTVTYARKYKDGDMSVQGERSLTIADSTMSLFRAETENWDRFSEGDEYAIEVDDNLYPAVVTGEEALGLPPQEKVPGERAYVYFVLREVSFELSDGDRGSFILELERHEDTLYVDKDAIMKAGDMEIVYYQTENGLKAYKEVETGLVVSGYAEILSGLSEGELVIVD